MTHCNTTNTEMIDEFREQCMNLSMNHIIVCNYSLHRISNGNGNGGGHFSVIIAYHKPTDRILLLDVWTQKSWVKLTELYAAMNTMTGNGSYRGYIVSTNIPIDIIRIKKKKKGKAGKFKFWGNKSNNKAKKNGKSKPKSKSKENKHNRKNKRKNKFGIF